MTTPAHLDRVLSALAGVRRSGDGWSARCPAHDDRHASLTVSLGDNDTVLIHCHRGCVTAAVLSAVGLAMPDLFPDNTRRGVTVERRHVYLDAQGTVLYAVDRIAFQRKDHTQRSWRSVHPDEHGRWISGRGDTPRVLYRLPVLLANPDLPVWITEGERDADTLERTGVIATTVASGRWEGVDLTTLAGRRVFVVVDNDRAGWARGLKALDAAQRAGALIEGVRRPGDDCKDATCWLAEGRGVRDLLDVDLTTEDPPCDAWITDEPPARIERFHTDDGRAYFAMPTKAMLYNPDLSDLAIRVFAIVDERAGTSGLAKLTAVEMANKLGRKSDRPIRDALRELVELDYLSEVKRGQWKVLNPARTPGLHENPFPPRDSNKTPGNRHKHAGSESTNVPVEKQPNQHERDGSETTASPIGLVTAAFPGAQIVTADPSTGVRVIRETDGSTTITSNKPDEIKALKKRYSDLEYWRLHTDDPAEQERLTADQQAVAAQLRTMGELA